MTLEERIRKLADQGDRVAALMAQAQREMEGLIADMKRQCKELKDKAKEKPEERYPYAVYSTKEAADDALYNLRADFEAWEDPVVLPYQQYKYAIMLRKEKSE